MSDFLDELEGLCTRWSERCSLLAEQAKYWEAGWLNEARRELGDMIKAEREKRPRQIITDQQVKDAYEKAQRAPMAPGWPVDPFAPYRNQRTAPFDWCKVQVFD